MVLHIIDPDKFTKPLANFLIEDERFKNHFFLSPKDSGIVGSKQIIDLRSPLSKNLFYNFRTMFSQCCKARRIVLHGLVLVHFFFFFPFFFHKISWVIYGYELEVIKASTGWYSRMLRFVLSRVNCHISHVHEDSEEANKLLKSKAKFIYSPMYLSNIVDITFFKAEDLSKKDSINVLVGNSTDPTNEHISIFDMLEGEIEFINKIFCPLSYGTHDEYRDKIIIEGARRFGDKFVPLTELMTIEKYIDFLKTIDVAVFNHNRQQAMGNTLTLLGLGKIVYMRSGTNSFESLTKRGFIVFDNKLIKECGFKVNREVLTNKATLENYYSMSVLIDSYINL
ncbi:TDP-N-acetylfucosamine:lipid II N-acetylfucosaminyltransferase [Flavobacterium chilense]|uniref:4-alpha-L-fucosyltransferase glycosyl transferase group 56 n=1 Tax=Flavobacterium chilense TaxID=946677 RepID=A0A1M7GTR5_9FLAO|nr:TDP-N-acetylfucosamine:lipid II N-acetylfucosaminyltransferase [Flavobacterium chilense]SHM19219.1 4-alpha-L-fucosyltransferase glycosyl transferase group 56 [Flavobacterium chilense]